MSSSLVLKIRANVEDPNVLDFASIALASCNPPISPEALEQIALIERARLDSLSGSEHFEASQIFEALRDLPPIHGLKIKNLLSALSSELISYESVVGYLTKKKDRPEKPIDSKPDADGFIALDGRMTVMEEGKLSGEEKPVQLSVEVESSESDCIMLCAEIVKRLICIANHELQRDLVSDCSRIMDLRLVFDL